MTTQWTRAPSLHHFLSHHLVFFLSWHSSSSDVFLFSIKAKTVSVSPPLYSEHVEDLQSRGRENKLCGPNVEASCTTSWSERGHRHSVCRLSYPTSRELKLRWEKDLGDWWHFYLFPFQDNVTNRPRFLFKSLISFIWLNHVGWAWENWNRPPVSYSDESRTALPAPLQLACANAPPLSTQRELRSLCSLWTQLSSNQ